ncbi:MAG: class I SAM-dependent methyltransferase [Nitrosopumilus sp.]|nr:class I SAM-dependent methyltransferase [Nitrosopumilus sp.]MDA7942727.1 class I SAM-dependent methyltransferase [Nitrosopumilus sp.]MDA7945287.1 class I SAM-dependent methyltransferase [Nitrosopumilus sp.]MDA7952759.1 class I SAM-dependent methyltransferase [Nitrosopumilus sp.]MDA7955263.1 class I SAM-dependent methyltransferase [Nitrosopumilus sp.]
MIRVLEDVIPVYDRVNRVISLGRDASHRRRGIEGRISGGDRVLDAGSGLGAMTAVAAGAGASVTMCDPLLPMLRGAAGRGADAAAACGVFEKLPFRDGAFDAVVCGYSLRDAINLRRAISEAHRVLAGGGRLVVVDLGKPDGPVQRAGVSFYLRCIMPLLALAAGGRLGAGFAAIYGTYRRWPRNGVLREMLLERFERVELETDLAGGAVMIAAYK